MNLPEKYHALGELIDVLNKYPKDTKVSCYSPDCGGYDVSLRPFCSILDDKDGEIVIGHAEAQASELWSDSGASFTYSDYKEYMEEEETN